MVASARLVEVAVLAPLLGVETTQLAMYPVVPSLVLTSYQSPLSPTTARLVLAGSSLATEPLIPAVCRRLAVRFVLTVKLAAAAALAEATAWSEVETVVLVPLSFTYLLLIQQRCHHR